VVQLVRAVEVRVQRLRDGDGKEPVVECGGRGRVVCDPVRVEVEKVVEEVPDCALEGGHVGVWELGDVGALDAGEEEEDPEDEEKECGDEHVEDYGAQDFEEFGGGVEGFMRLFLDPVGDV